jgi:hypothetical protein
MKQASIVPTPEYAIAALDRMYMLGDLIALRGAVDHFRRFGPAPNSFVLHK